MRADQKALLNLTAALNFKLNPSNFEFEIFTLDPQILINEKIIQKGSIDDFGYLLDEAWQYKREISGNISNFKIDEISLFDHVRSTIPQDKETNSVLNFCDNASAIRGFKNIKYNINLQPPKLLYNIKL